MVDSKFKAFNAYVLGNFFQVNAEEENKKFQGTNYKLHDKVGFDIQLVFYLNVKHNAKKEPL